MLELSWKLELIGDWKEVERKLEVGTKLVVETNLELRWKFDQSWKLEVGSWNKVES